MKIRHIKIKIEKREKRIYAEVLVNKTEGEVEGERDRSQMTEACLCSD